MKLIQEYGVRYWRAVYEVVIARQEGVDHDVDGRQKIVVEWACDAADDGLDVCGDKLTRVLPGFDMNGRPSAQLVQLDLRYRYGSSFDGVPMWHAALDGARVIDAPQLVHFRGLPEGSVIVP